MLSTLAPEKAQLEGRQFASPWPVMGILGAYLYFVIRAGPRMMANKPPYSLRGLVLGYNAFIVLASLWTFIKLNQVVYGQFFTITCQLGSLDRKVYDEMFDVGYMYFALKIVELLDTVFFVLRKKFNQVSLLHVYHHFIAAYMSLTYLPSSGGEFLIVTYLNTFVHILMYSYYFLSALGPAVQKYLWWKKYLTMIQIIQFIIIIGYSLMLLFHPGCQVSKEALVISISLVASVLVLFSLFYANKYSSKNPRLQ